MVCTLLDSTKVDEVKSWLNGSCELIFSWSDYKYDARLNNKIDIAQSLETYGEFPLIWKVQPYKKSKDNYDGWTSLKPKVDVLLDELVLKMKGALPPVPVIATVPTVKEAIIADPAAAVGSVPATEVDTTVKAPAIEAVPVKDK